MLAVLIQETANFKTLEYKAMPSAAEYERQFQEGWVIYTPPYAIFHEGGASGFDKWVHHQTYKRIDSVCAPN